MSQPATEPFVPDENDIDDVILFRIGGNKVNTGDTGPLGVAVFDGQQKPFPVHPGSGKPIVTYNLPYVVYTSNVGLPIWQRLSGRRAGNSTFFALTYVGGDRWQTKWAGKALRDALNDQRIVVGGVTSGLIGVDVSPRIWRDDDAMRPDGSPLYYGVDEYAVPLAIRTVPTGGP